MDKRYRGLPRSVNWKKAAKEKKKTNRVHRKKRIEERQGTPEAIRGSAKCQLGFPKRMTRNGTASRADASSFLGLRRKRIVCNTL
jgi:P2-related tail formation protein